MTLGFKIQLDVIVQHYRNITSRHEKLCTNVKKRNKKFKNIKYICFFPLTVVVGKGVFRMYEMIYFVASEQVFQ